MRTQVLLGMILLFGSLSANAQWFGNKKVKGNGNRIIQNRKTENYEGVKLVGFMDTQLVPGEEGTLKVEAESNLQEYIITEVNNGVLKISIKNNIDLQPSGNSGIKVTVSYRDLKEVSVTGSGDLWNEGTLKSRNFDISLTGSGDIKLQLETEQTNAKITGSGDIFLKGNSKELNCSITGSGDFDAAAFKAESVNAQVSGSGDMQVYASQKLSAKVSGSGDITYDGKPEKEDFKSFGSGSISSK